MRMHIPRVIKTRQACNIDNRPRCWRKVYHSPSLLATTVVYAINIDTHYVFSRLLHFLQGVGIQMLLRHLSRAGHVHASIQGAILLGHMFDPGRDFRRRRHVWLLHFNGSVRVDAL